MQNHVGKYYNNTLYNGITWMVLIFQILRLSFELAANGLLRKMGFKEYLRIRLRKSLWYLGFYSCSYLYCSATLWKNHITLPDRQKFHVLHLTEPISGHLILGYVLLCAFFISSTIWEGLLCSFSFFRYLFLTGFVAFTYFLSYIELAILLANTISGIHVITEFTRCLSCIIKGHLNLPRLLVNCSFILTIVTFFKSYLLTVTFGFIFPISQGLHYNSKSVIMIGLNTTLWGWFICEIYMSPLFRLIKHQWRHQSSTANIVPECCGSMIDCALFKPRDDVAYNLKIIRKEIEERETRMKALRKPKRSAKLLLQTLKCVAALNRKLKYKRHVKGSETGGSPDSLDTWNAQEEKEMSSTVFDSEVNTSTGEVPQTETEVMENDEKNTSDSLSGNPGYY